MQAYCMKCRRKVGIMSPTAITMKNGRPAIQGACPACGTRVSRIIGREEMQPSATPLGRRPPRDTDLEYLADSPEFIAQTMDATGLREKLRNVFQEAIDRANRPISQS